MRPLLLLCLVLLSACGEPQATLPERELLTPGECDVSRESCLAQGEDQTVRLQLGPNVVPMQPFPFIVEVEGMAAEAVVVEFSMPGMAMGQNRYRLLAEGNGLWRGEGMLPICSTGRLDWLATVRVEGADEHLLAAFPFATGTP